MNPHIPDVTVYVNPVNTKSITVWKKGTVTALVSNTTVQEDEVARHIGDIRLCHTKLNDIEGTAVEVSLDNSVPNLLA